ncbi:MAG: MFS transporter, partial [Pseudomonadota bacterium]
MLTAIRNSWALLFGMTLLMIGNGLQGTVLGVRGDAEGMSPSVLGFVMSAYFLGFLGGTQVTPYLLRKVGHVRVFAALASMISAAFILYAAVVDPIAWFLMRVMVGFCLSGVYVVAESWLNDGATNETRGQTMSAYIFAQMLGIIVAQALLNVADPGGYDLFVIMSVLVSISFAPILL